jgi:hypothetical protein
MSRNGSAMPGRVADAIADAAECRIGTFDVFDVDRAECRLGFFVTVLDGMSGGEMPINVCGRGCRRCPRRSASSSMSLRGTRIVLRVMRPASGRHAHDMRW